MIEKSRHRKIDLENKLCPLCKFEAEDEFVSFFFSDIFLMDSSQNLVYM
jgi:hypothetical protein